MVRALELKTKNKYSAQIFNAFAGNYRLLDKKSWGL